MTPETEPLLEASEATADSPAPVPSTPSTAPDKTLWWEVLAVLCVGVFPYLSSSIVTLIQPWEPLRYWLDMLDLTIRATCISMVVLYIVHRSGLSWASFGLVRPGLGDLGAGLILFVADSYLWWKFAPLLPDDPHPTTRFHLAPRLPADYLLMVLAHTANAFSEELVVRGYLIKRLEGLTRSTVLAVLLAAICFASYHIHYGPGRSLLLIFFMGLLYGGLYAWVRRLWPFVLAHMFINISNAISR